MKNDYQILTRYLKENDLYYDFHKLTQQHRSLTKIIRNKQNWEIKKNEDISDIKWSVVYNFTPRDFEKYYFKEKYNINTIDILYAFLIDNNAYKEYLHNLYQLESFSNYNTVMIGGIIDASFNWDETKEGSAYWSHLNSSFYHHMELVYSNRYNIIDEVKEKIKKYKVDKLIK